MRVSRAIGANRHPQDLFGVLVDELRRVVQFDFVGVSLRDQNSGTCQDYFIDAASRSAIAPEGKIFIDVASRLAIVPEDELTPEESVTSWVYEHQQPLLRSTDELESRFGRLQATLKRLQIQSTCALPLTTAHRKLGVIAFCSKQVGTYAQEEVKFISQVADQIALAFDDALNFTALRRASEELQTKNERLQLLLDITNQVVSNLELREVLRAISRHLRRVMQCDYAGLSLPDIHVLGQIANQIALAVENALAFREIRELKDQLSREKLYLEDEIRAELNFAQIIGSSPALRRVLKQVGTVAPTDSTVLIYGETGTGKELIARAIHDLSPRRSKPFVKLNCAAIPTGLLESELFGHEKGAFTGAIAQRIGRFEVADSGTIFLDEIGEIPLELQTKLLRVLQEREFERLGSSKTLRTNARLIAATNRNLEAMVAEQKFRSDLFFRINVFPVHIPPLRERQEDIPLLVRHFTQQFCRRMNKVIDTVPSATMDALRRYQWPGNIRELQNMIERAVIISTGPVLNLDVADLKLQPAGFPEKKAAAPNSENNAALRDVLEKTERLRILEALERSNWVVAGPRGAAGQLGMKRSTLQHRIRKLGIKRGTA